MGRAIVACYPGRVNISDAYFTVKVSKWRSLSNRKLNPLTVWKHKIAKGDINSTTMGDGARLAAYVAMRLSDFLHSLDDITEPDPAYMAMIGFGNNIEFGSSEGRPIFDFKKDEDES